MVNWVCNETSTKYTITNVGTLKTRPYVFGKVYFVEASLTTQISNDKLGVLCSAK